MDIVLKDIKVTIANQILATGDLLLTKNIYFLVAKNGSGKSVLLKQLEHRILPLPKNIDTFLVEQEMIIDITKTVYQSVAEANRKLVLMQQRLLEIENDDNQYEEYSSINDALQSMDYMRDEAIIRKLLHKLGFTLHMQNQKVEELSGGWRMRVNLAKGLYMQPLLLLLDEPTNHLDLETILWLTEEIKKYPHKCLIVSHDVHFMNAAANGVIAIESFKLHHYNGNYDYFLKARAEEYRIQLKNYQLNEKQINNAKKLNKKPPAKISPPKKPYVPKIITFNSEIKAHKPLALTHYSLKYDMKVVLNEINLDIHPKTRLALVGLNGCGKSSLLKAVHTVALDNNVKVGFYHQHLIDALENSDALTAVKYLKNQFVQSELKLQDQQLRERLGSIGLESSAHLRPLHTLSGGQRARVVLALIILKQPELLLLDEPTNHLDIETIDALIDYIKEYQGSVIVVSHNMNFITQLECQVMKIKDGQLYNTLLDDYVDEVLNE